MFLPDVVLPQVFDETKDQKMIRKDTNDILEFCVKFASILKMSSCTKSHFGNMVSTYIFLPDVVLPQNFDETKDQKIIHKDMKDSWNSVLDLLVYPKCPIK